MKLTIKIQKDGDWWVGQFEELPAVLDQGRTIEELRSNLFEALDFYLETQRLLFAESGSEVTKPDVIREEILLTAA